MCTRNEEGTEEAGNKSTPMVAEYADTPVVYWAKDTEDVWTVFIHLSVWTELGFFGEQAILILISQMTLKEPLKTWESGKWN